MPNLDTNRSPAGPGGRLSLRSQRRLRLTCGYLVSVLVVEAMREVGIELADATPKLLTPLLQQLADLTVTMGCGDACPLVRAPVIERDLEDPKDRPLKEVRRIGDDIAFRVGELVASRFADSPAR